MSTTSLSTDDAGLALSITSSQERPGAHRFATAALTLTMMFTVTSCTRAPLGQIATASHASDQMQSLVKDTMKVAGGRWTSTSDGPSPDSCSTPSGEEGVTFSWDQIADGVEDPTAALERVDGAWRDKGLATNTQSVKRADGEILHRVGSVDRDVDTILFSATTDRMTIEVQSLCGTGNVNDFIKR
ncbi:hypothetical protein [Curtobacterium sp. MMLR14_010]|uniref:hypothetical protein n=1 Tax=Curtobacterium sp. MMLR14_010 TaxID=1898743 RepID=UPI00111392C6|nr:hypothetical protein [Curtobacterium sp. MMLR14_010]